jgi:hypothetical protein
MPSGMLKGWTLIGRLLQAGGTLTCSPILFQSDGWAPHDKPWVPPTPWHTTLSSTAKPLWVPRLPWALWFCPQHLQPTVRDHPKGLLWFVYIWRGIRTGWAFQLAVAQPDGWWAPMCFQKSIDVWMCPFQRGGGNIQMKHLKTELSAHLEVHRGVCLENSGAADGRPSVSSHLQSKTWKQLWDYLSCGDWDLQANAAKPPTVDLSSMEVVTLGGYIHRPPCLICHVQWSLALTQRHCSKWRDTSVRLITPLNCLAINLSHSFHGDVSLMFRSPSRRV